MFKRLSNKIVYKNKWMEVYEDGIEFENGSQSIYGYVKRNDGVEVLIFNQNDEVLLIKQYRYPIQDFQWCLPGGAIDPKESAEEAARREVLEETGIEIVELERVTDFYPLSSNSTEKDILFFAHPLKVPQLSERTSQVDESFTEKKFIPLKEVLKMIDENQITDVYTCNALQTLARRLKIY